VRQYFGPIKAPSPRITAFYIFDGKGSELSQTASSTQLSSYAALIPILWIRSVVRPGTERKYDYPRLDTTGSLTFTEYRNL
jgi:hypothetical protein